MRSASARTATSVEPPGAKATTMRIGLAGHWACALASASSSTGKDRSLLSMVSPFIIRRFHAGPLRPARDRGRGPAILGRAALVQRHRGQGAPEILLPVDVPLPLGQAAYGARAQLHDR